MQRVTVLVLALLSPFVVATAPDTARVETVQPGAFALFEDGDLCTLNWVFDEVVPAAADRDARVFIGTAAHCTSGVGQTVALATPSIAVTFETGPTFGRVAHIDDDLDFALVEIDPSWHDRVDPSMRGHPDIPTGVSTTATAAFGDLLQLSGNGIGYHQSAPTREQRVAALSTNSGRWFWAFGSATPGDSGGPVANLSDGGTALGLATAIAVGYVDDSTTGLQAGINGVSIEGAMADAAGDGIELRLRTVPG